MPSTSLRGRRVLITSGPTREYLDPVRFLTNASSGAMGFALAAAARAAGARVSVVSGPTALRAPRGVEVVRVTAALEMRREVLRRVRAADLIIGAAAVCDWRLVRVARHKIKRGPGRVSMNLTPNPDIIKAAASRRRPGQVFIGFALETRAKEANARAKLKRKGLDLVAANGPSCLASGRARLTLVGRTGDVRLPEMPKARAARAILAEATRLLELRD